MKFMDLLPVARQVLRTSPEGVYRYGKEKGGVLFIHRQGVPILESNPGLETILEQSGVLEVSGPIKKVFVKIYGEGTIKGYSQANLLHRFNRFCFETPKVYLAKDHILVREYVEPFETFDAFKERLKKRVVSLKEWKERKRLESEKKDMTWKIMNNDELEHLNLNFGDDYFCVTKREGLERLGIFNQG